ncbi:MAG: NAD-binding protein [Desulfovibrionaceae bacterium]
MKILLCGTGQVTLELLRRLGETWDVTLNDIDAARLSDVMARFPVVKRVVSGDASSPVLLEKAAMDSHDFVLALTGDDAVNLAVARQARERGVAHILALVNRQDNAPAFQDIGVRTLSLSLLPARTIFHYLQDPRIRVTSLGDGRAEIIEVEVAAHSWVVGKSVELFRDRSWRITGILRGERLVRPTPETVIEADDTLVIMGEPPLYDPVCALLECATPSFPLGYGGTLLLALPHTETCDKDPLLAEGLYLAQNTKAKRTQVICEKGTCDLEEWLRHWGATIDVASQCVDHDLMGRLRDICLEKRVGLVVTPLLEASFFQSLTKPTIISLAHSLPCPLLVAKASHPYRRILVPFRDTPRCAIALETAMDIARQMRATVGVVVVREPDFISGAGEGEDAERLLVRARDLALSQKCTLEEHVREGNPVHEITALAREYDLLVVGSSRKEKGLFTPNVGELITERSPCSVLVVTG